jgi:chemosensory pili system protein ChpA (sensor histidine kinase/response regulator)
MDLFAAEILQGFVAEARSYLTELRALLERDLPDVDTGACRHGYRLLHCMRGAASMLELGDVARTAEGGEKLLEAIAAGFRPYDEPARERLRSVLGAIEAALAGLAAVPGEVLAAPPAPSAAEEAPGSPVFGASAPPAAPDFDSIPDEIVSGFLEEAEEHLEAITAALRAPIQTAASLGEPRRRIHSLKGTANMVGFSGVGRLSHALEDLLDEESERQGEVPADRLTLLHEAVDTLEDLVRRPHDPEVAGRVEPLVARLRGGGAPLLEEAFLPAPPPEPGEPLPETPAPAPAARAAAGEQVRVPLGRIDPLVRVASELLVERSVLERFYRDLVRQTGELRFSLRRLRDLADRLERGAVAPVPPVQGLPAAGSRAVAAAEFDALELDRYSELDLLSRGLLELVSDVEAVGSELAGTSSDVEGFLIRQQRLIRGLQEGLLHLRAVPFASLAGRLHRTARVTAALSGRAVHLELEAGTVELDKSVLDEMADPLFHLVRNAIGHGIEEPAVRRALGKPEQGRVRVAARYQGGQAVLEVADDGAGIDLEAVRAAAVAGGLLSAEAVAGLSGDEARALVFLPGFSTARSVSEVSGRGVGLDVVHSRVQSLRGSLSLESEPGQGTRFVIRLPLSLAVTRALLVRVAGRSFALPAAAVVRVVRVEAEDIRAEGDGAFLNLDGEELSLRPLGDLLGLPASGEPPAPRPLVAVLDLGGDHAAFLIDELLESREVVVKPLGPLLRRVDGLAGATLLGDGSVVPILDPYTFPRGTGRPALPVLLRGPAPARLEVLIVDDSLGVRRVLSNLAAKAGWLPATAKDGLEALETLQQRRRPPDAILLDIEMPRMDGYELTATLRGLADYNGVPIVMITSRAGTKHRDKALGLGVSKYLVKPFQPETLVRTVESLVAERRAVIALRESAA